MSKYTTELRYIIESGTPVFDFQYPFYDESKRLEFQNRFIRHFYFHEIGFETVGLFKYYLENKFNEILPYYNEMFRTALLSYDPLLNYDVKESYTKTTNETTLLDASGEQRTQETANDIATNTETNTAENLTEETRNTDTTNKQKVDGSGTVKDTTENTTDTTNNTNVNKAHSDTPQGKISIDSTSYVSDLDREDSKQTVKSTEKGTGNKTTTSTENVDGSGTEETTAEVYSESGYTTTNNGTNRNETTGNVSIENTSTGNKDGQETYTRTMLGNIGVQTAPDLLEKHLLIQRKLQTIENQFFDECQDLFMQLW